MTANTKAPTTPISPAIARSWLLLPATASDRYQEACDSAVDVVVIDIEDGVRLPDKPAAREAMVRWLQEGGQAWVRINDVRSPEWEKDLAALKNAPGLLGVMLAKTENPEHVNLTADRLAPGTPIVALIESADGLVNAAEIGKTKSVIRLAFGVGDFRRDTGIGASPMALAYTRSQFAISSRVARIAPPIDGPTISNDRGELRDAAEHAVDMGMTGKLCLSTDQAPFINEALSPSAADVAWATGVINELGMGGERVKDGSDMPRLARAQKIARLAAAFGV